MHVSLLLFVLWATECPAFRTSFMTNFFHTVPSVAFRSSNRLCHIYVGQRMCTVAGNRDRTQEIRDRTREIKNYFEPIFKLYDKDKDGLIDKYEMMITDRNADLTESEVPISDFDQDTDGKLNLEESIIISLRAYFLSTDWYTFKVIIWKNPDLPLLLRFNKSAPDAHSLLPCRTRICRSPQQILSALSGWMTLSSSPTCWAV